jgi:hypothetical protein
MLRCWRKTLKVQSTRFLMALLVVFPICAAQAARLDAGAPLRLQNRWAVPIVLRCETGENIASLQFSAYTEADASALVGLQLGQAANIAGKQPYLRLDDSAAHVLIAGLNQRGMRSGVVTALLFETSSPGEGPGRIVLQNILFSTPDGRAQFREESSATENDAERRPNQTERNSAENAETHSDSQKAPVFAAAPQEPRPGRRTTPFAMNPSRRQGGSETAQGQSYNFAPTRSRRAGMNDSPAEESARMKKFRNLSQGFQEERARQKGSQAPAWLSASNKTTPASNARALANAIPSAPPSKKNPTEAKAKPPETASTEAALDASTKTPVLLASQPPARSTPNETANLLQSAPLPTQTAATAPALHAPNAFSARNRAVLLVITATLLVLLLRRRLRVNRLPEN